MSERKGHAHGVASVALPTDRAIRGTAALQAKIVAALCGFGSDPV